jgi:hypothetical protein
MEMSRGQPAPAAMQNPERPGRTDPAGNHRGGRLFSRMAFGFKFMFSPVSVKMDVNESHTAIGTRFFMSASTQWKVKGAFANLSFLDSAPPRPI